MENIKYLRKREEDLSRRSAVVLPICIVVDTSASMKMFKDDYGVTRMQRINDGIDEFLSEIKKDDMLLDSVEISIISFNDNAMISLPFTTIDKINNINLEASNLNGDTPKGVEMALEILDKEKKNFKNNKIKYNQPWMVIFSDGRATPGKKMVMNNGQKDFSDINSRLKRVQEKTVELEKNGKLTVIPVLISEPSNGQFKIGLKQMKGFSSTNRALVLGDHENSLKFKDFFKILSRSVSVNNSNLIFQSVKGQENITNQELVASSIKDNILSRNDYSFEVSKKIDITILANISLQNRIKNILYSFKDFKGGDLAPINFENNNLCRFFEDKIVLNIDIENEVKQIYIVFNIEGYGEIVNIYQTYNSSILIDLNYQIEANREKEEFSFFEKEILVDKEEEIVPTFNYTIEDVDEIEEEPSIVDKKLDVISQDDEYLKNLLEDIDDWDEI